MDKLKYYQWHGSWLLLVVLTPLLPVALAYFMSNLVVIETTVPDATKLGDFLTKRRG